MCLPAHVYAMYVWMLRKPARAEGAWKLDLQVAVSWDPNSCPLEEQQALLPAKPPLQPLNNILSPPISSLTFESFKIQTVKLEG